MRQIALWVAIEALAIVASALAAFSARAQLPVKGISCRTGALAAQVASAAMDLLASSSTNSAISPL
jgi:hypothetical protein